MKSLMTLIAMQLKEKLNVKGTVLTIGQKIAAVVFAILKFGLIVALCYALFFVARLLQLFSLIDVVPVSVLTVVFTVMFIVSVISATASLTKSMYYSYDNPVLLTLPCRPTQVYFSKLIVFYIYELIRNLSFMVPLFLAFGLINGYATIYYPLVFLFFVFAPATITTIL